MPQGTKAGLTKPGFNFLISLLFKFSYYTIQLVLFLVGVNLHKEAALCSIIIFPKDIAFEFRFPRIVEIPSYTPPEVSAALISLGAKSTAVYDIALGEQVGRCILPCEICEKKLKLSFLFNKGHLPAFAVRGVSLETTCGLQIYCEWNGSSPDLRHFYRA